MRPFMKVYHASKIEEKNADIVQYNEPTEIVTRANYFTVEKASATGGLAYLQYGTEVNSIWTVIANARIFSETFKIGDLFWVDGDKPIKDIEDALGIGSTATAIVTNITNQGRTIVLTLSTNKEKEYV